MTLEQEMELQLTQEAPKTEETTETKETPKKPKRAPRPKGEPKMRRPYKSKDIEVLKTRYDKFVAQYCTLEERRTKLKEKLSLYEHEFKMRNFTI